MQRCRRLMKESDAAFFSDSHKKQGAKIMWEFERHLACFAHQHRPL